MNSYEYVGYAPPKLMVCDPVPSPRSNWSDIVPHDPDTVMLIWYGPCNLFTPLPWLATENGRLIVDTAQGSVVLVVELEVDELDEEDELELLEDELLDD